MGSLHGYLREVRAVLRPAFCLHNFPSPLVERHNKPFVEWSQHSPELLLPPVTVSRGDQEHARVEQSINSTRVSFRFRAADSMEEYLLRTYLCFLVHRADDLQIVRRVPLPGYDLTFLVTWAHLERFRRDDLIDFICMVDWAGLGWSIMAAWLLMGLLGRKLSRGGWAAGSRAGD